MSKAELQALAWRAPRKQTLEEAILMQQEGHWNTCTNRLY